MNRREFIQCAALITAGASQAPNLWAMTKEQHDFIASQPPYIDRQTANLFSQSQRQVVSAIAEHVIPRTDTPGAIDAGAPKFIEVMVGNWFDDSEREFFVTELNALMKAEPEFLNLTDAEQLNILDQLEDDAADAAWFTSGNMFRVWDSTAPFICQIKELTVLGFMLSKTGGEQFLRTNQMGAFSGSVPLDKGASAFNTERPMRSFSAPIPGVLEDE